MFSIQRPSADAKQNNMNVGIIESITYRYKVNLSTFVQCDLLHLPPEARS